MAKIKIKKISINLVSEKLKTTMFSIFSKYYESVDFDKFQYDLSKKTDVMLLYDTSLKGEQLIGFSTILRIRCKTTIAYTALFSGDTVVEKEYWGRKDLQKAFFFYILQTKILYFWRPVYWFLISKGYKTYMMMLNNFKYTYPCRLDHTPELEQAILDEFYSNMFENLFDKSQGIIASAQGKDFVKEGYTDISDEDLANEDIQFFLNKNPEFDKGSELACITKIVWGDFFFHIPKFFLNFIFKKSATSRRAR